MALTPEELAYAADEISPADREEQEFLQEARVKYKYDRDIDREDRELAEKDQLFASGGENQWEPAELAIRKALKRPLLTWNRLHSFAQQVQNDGRKNNPAILVTRDDNGDPDEAKLRADRIRQIEYESNAPTVYQTSRDAQIICGRAFYRVVTEYKTPTSNKQVIRLKPIVNQFSVTCDGNAFAYDRSDAEHWFIETIMSKAAYKRRFGRNTKAARSNFFEGAETEYDDWMKCGGEGQSVRVCEYWCKEYYDRTLCTLVDKTTQWEDDLAPNTPVLKRETRQDYKIKQYIIDGVGILEETEWVGRYFPIVPVWGRVEIVNGKLRHVSLIRNSHDAQRLVNLFVSNIAEQVAMMPKTPYIGYKGQFEGVEKVWANVNEVPRAYMEVNPVVHNGVLLPPPQRVQSEPPIQALTIGLNQAIDALKASMNIYDASLGAGPIDASGLALQQRNQESDVANFHFSDNEAWSRKYLGQVLLDLIPKIDAKNESITVRDERGRTRVVEIGKAQKDAQGKAVVHDLTEGEFQPHISTGPSHTTARQQAAAAFGQIAQSDPNFMHIAGDIYMRALDFPGAEELADRYERMLPPDVMKPGDPAQAQAKLTQALGQIKQLAEELHKAHDIIETKKIETAAKIQMTQMQEETKRQNLALQGVIAEAQMQSSSNIEALKAQTGAIQHSVEVAHEKDAAEFDALLQRLEAMGVVQDQQAEDAQEPAQ